MRINADFSKRVLVHSEELSWQPSPMPGVVRRPLDRIGAEIARATTIVRYEPGSTFSEHTHTGGEEFIVLDGVFQDEYGDYPAGTYVRNPPTSRHSPRSDAGCTIFVKLWQFDLSDRTQQTTNLTDIGHTARTGKPIRILPLFENEHETVRLEAWAPNTEVTYQADGGAEILVLEGSIREGLDQLQKYSWLRVPDAGTLTLCTADQPAQLWVKTGHLRSVSVPQGVT